MDYKKSLKRKKSEKISREDNMYRMSLPFVSAEVAHLVSCLSIGKEGSSATR